MEYTTLGSTGMRVSRICLGTMSFGWQLEEKESLGIIQRALELGINYFDTANIYAGGRSEAFLGKALKGRRHEALIATKAFWTLRKNISPGLARNFLLKELNDSLERLQTDHVDLFYIHRFDDRIGLENILRTLNIGIQQGKIGHLGASTMYAWQLMEALWVADRLNLEGFQVIQPHYNLLYREEEREMLPMGQQQGLAVSPWSPLAKGALTGKYLNMETIPDDPRTQEIAYWFLRPEDVAVTRRVVEVAHDRDKTPAQIALAWMLSKPVITAPVVGVSSMRHLEEAVEAVEIELAEDEILYLEELYQPRALTGHYGGQAMPGDDGYLQQVALSN